MGLSEELFSDAVNYIRIELIAVIFGNLGKYFTLIIIMLELNKMLYVVMITQMISSVFFDFGFASTYGLDFGVIGIAYSSLASNIAVFMASFIVIIINLDFDKSKGSFITMR